LRAFPSTDETIMSPSPKSLLLHWRARLVPESRELGWMPLYSLGYLMFLFMPLVLSWFGESFGWRGSLSHMLAPTLLSIAVFLPVYFAAYRTKERASLLCTLTIAVIAYALLPFNPFANTYIIYAAGFAAMLGGALWKRLLLTMSILAGLQFEIIALDYPIFVFLVTMIVSLAVFFGNHHFAVSTRKRAELKLSHDEVRRLAALAERERIGRDLHDLLGHTLSLVALKSELAGKLLQRSDSAQAREAAHREIVDVSRVARDALAQVRSAVTGIRAAGLAAELVSAKLLLEIDAIAFESVIAPDCLDGGVLPAKVETALALTVREAVTNIQRHARAQTARVELKIEAGHVVLCIIDDGRSGAIVPGNGLSGMRERIEALGGRLRIDTRKGAGTRVEARVPLAAHAGTIDADTIDAVMIDDATNEVPA
jgi:two-component system, NarL family, sensor histidine kinase DesK